MSGRTPNEEIFAQINRRGAFLRDIVRSGGVDTWGHLKTHGHHHATRDHCLRAGFIDGSKSRFEITDAGRFDIEPLPGDYR